ncbi:mitochondrial K+-H+ exchange-related-domain-containing protein [Fimicolochytrium jonesii]|uniref:mitochondrial K+-H+ exchange-related-domain-containing protein n=1 Tax=Fimicolochytrium jonesii TaxID=1396493 RepID=UPI0022FDE4F7|nr:mitochondrial K+-H+ exchange-related-domain-containing protein [Fimicolochytrium jonesii]KAI8822000.1 mitochondrial K+-H+ exchange-related-domain-containing protein [Fimicolochytrium jonesii]
MRIVILPVTRAALRSQNPNPAHLLHHVNVPSSSLFHPERNITPTTTTQGGTTISLDKNSQPPSPSPQSPTTSNPAPAQSLDGKPLLVQWTAKGVAWSTTKWKDMGAKPDTSFTKKLHIFGEKLKDVAPADEWFLKSVPSYAEIHWDRLLPDADVNPLTSASDDSESSPSSHPSSQSPTTTTTAPLTIHHPTQILTPYITTHLTTLISTARTKHSRNLTLSILCLPLSACFAVLPGPNVPLAWNLFRLYSNWRALQGVRTLDVVLGGGKEGGNVVYVPDERIDGCLGTWAVDQNQYIPAKVVRCVVEKEVADEHLGDEAARLVKQLRRKEAGRFWWLQGLHKGGGGKTGDGSAGTKADDPGANGNPSQKKQD